MPRYFTLEQAETIRGEVEDLLRQALSLKSELDETERVLRGEAERIHFSGGAVVRRDQVASAMSRRESAAARLRDTLAAITGRGCLVKDLDSGLLDFPTLFHGEEVYLCWKLGEPEIGFWHPVSDGFRGRRPIDQDFLDHHRGGS